MPLPYIHVIPHYSGYHSDFVFPTSFILPFNAIFIHFCMASIQEGLSVYQAVPMVPIIEHCSNAIVSGCLHSEFFFMSLGNVFCDLSCVQPCQFFSGTLYRLRRGIERSVKTIVAYHHVGLVYIWLLQQMLQVIVFALIYSKTIVIGSFWVSNHPNFKPHWRFTPVVLTATPSVLKWNHTLICRNLARFIIIIIFESLPWEFQGGDVSYLADHNQYDLEALQCSHHSGEERQLSVCSDGR